MVRDDVPNETQRSVVLAFQQHGQDDVLAPYVEKYLAAADTMWEEKGTQRASTALEYIFPRPLASQDLLDRVDAWLETSSANPAAKRYVNEGRADVARALAAQAKDAQPALTRYREMRWAGSSVTRAVPVTRELDSLGWRVAGRGRARRAWRCRASARPPGRPRRTRTASGARRARPRRR